MTAVFLLLGLLVSSVPARASTPIAESAAREVRLPQGGGTVLADSMRDFSGTQGQAGWRYGHYPGPFTAAAFTEMTQFDAATRIWWVRDGTYWTSLTDFGGHPNSTVTSGGRLAVEHWAVRRWTSSATGTLTLAGRLAKRDGSGGDGISGLIFVDGAEVYRQAIAGTDTTGVTFRVTVSAAQGSLLDFAIAPGGNDFNDNSDFQVTIETSGDFGAAHPQTFGIDPQGAYAPDPVNLATGVFAAQATDLVLPGRVLSFAFTRWHNSADQIAGPLGLGWTHSYNWTLADTGSAVEIRRGDGRRDRFMRGADGSYAAPPGVFDTLTKNADGTYALVLTNQLRYDFSAAGRLLAIREPAGNRIALAYTGSNLTTITDTVGRQVALSYDAQNRLVRLEDPAGRATTYAYDTSGRLASVTDRIGNGSGPAGAHRWTYAYDGTSGRLRSLGDPDGRVRVTNTYDAQGRVTQQRDALGALTTISYGAGQTTLTGPRGHASTYAFDSRMRVLSQSDAVGAQTLTVSYSYDAAGNRTSVTDRRGKRTDFAYDGRGNLLTKTDPSPDGVSPRPVTAFAYDSRNDLTRITDAAGFATAMTYDPRTNVLTSVSRQIDALSSAKTTYEYADPVNPGLPSRITSPRGNLGAAPDPAFSTVLAYDAQGNLVRRTDADGAVFTFDYDAVGRLVSFVDPGGSAPGAVPADHTWRVAYDELDRETSRTDPLGGVLRYAYDGAGNRTSLTDRGGNLTSYTYDANARLSTVEQRPDPAGSPATIYTTSVARDANGNATRITQANGVATEYAFDALDRLTSVTTRPAPTTPLTTSYVLDGNGQPTSRTTGDGVTVGYTYDDLSRLTAVSGPALSITYAYDAVGRRTRMTDATGVTMYQYDGLGRPTQLAAPAGTLGYAYDLDGNRTRLVYPGGDAVNYAYSPGGRLTSLSDWAGRSSTYTYQASGLVSSLRFPNAMTATYQYDRAQRLASLSYTLGGTIVAQNLALDPEGNRTAMSETVQGMPATSSALRYDGLNRLLSFDRRLANGTPVSNEAFTLDGATNLTTRTGPAATYTYDGANRLSSDGARSFVWDGADRLVSRGADTFSYDALSRVVSSTVAGTTRTYAYDGDGLLGSRTQGAFVTSFLWDSTVAPAPLLVAGTDRIVHGLGPLYVVHASGTYDTYARDALGSVRAEVSGTGQLTNAYDYAAYGSLRASLVGPPRLLGYAGELTDPSGLIYLRARWYDPVTGRFVSRDSLLGSAGAPTTLNTYGYAAANPVRNVDPSGLCTDPGGPGIRYCVNTFIPQDSMLGFAGDARGAMSNGGSYRFQQMITRSAEGELRQETTMGISRFGSFEREAERGLCGGRGSAGGLLSLTCSASDGLLHGFAPWVGYALQIRETASGGTVQHVFASAWPSLEVWEYRDNRSPRLLFFNDAGGRGILNTGWQDFELGPGK